MILRDSFSTFLKNSVDLNATRLSRIRSAHQSVRSVLSFSDQIPGVYAGDYLQGSYALGTGTRSSSGAAYDVDVVLAHDMKDEWGGLPSGRSVLNAVYGVLEAQPLYAGKVEVRERCVRVSYSSDGMDFHLDVLPAHVPDGLQGVLQIPTDWATSNPRGFKTWFDDVNRNGCGYLRRVVRLLKYWRGVQALDGPNSMVLTTLAGLHLPANALSEDDALVLTLEGIAAWAEAESSWTVPTVPNPSMEEENLARAWGVLDWSAFRATVSRAAEAARTARDTKDEEEAVALWNGTDLFNGTFPTALRGLGAAARQHAAAFTSGTLTVGAGGVVGVSAGRVVTPNRGFYGRRP